MQEISIINKFIPLSMLRIPQKYQRHYSEKRVLDIAEHWDDKQMRPLCVSLRPDGYYYIFDGQHTREAWELVKGNEPIECRVYTGLDEKSEADLFAKMNSDGKSLSPGEIVRARYEAKNPQAVMYINMLRNTNTPFTYEISSDKTKFSGHGYLQEKINAVGFDVVEKTLSLISENISTEKRNYSGQFVVGLIAFLKTYQKEVDMNRIAKVLQKNDPKEILAKGKEYYQQASKTVRGAANGKDFGAKYYAKAFLDFYNKLSRKGRLDEEIIIMKKRLFENK